MSLLEVRIPISPRPAWLNRTKLIAASVRMFYPDAIIRVYIGQPGGPTAYAVRQCEDALRGFGIEWIGAAEFDAWQRTRSEYLATMMRRYNPPFDGDHILMLDADVFPVGRFDELFETRALQGVQAHHAPYGAEGWRQIFAMWGLPCPPMTFPYSGFGAMFNDESQRFGPFYPNSGVVFGPRVLFERISTPFVEAICFLRQHTRDTYWFDQIGFTLGVALAGVPVKTLPLRYNFPNRPSFERANPEELKDIRFVHAMHTGTIHRDRDFESFLALRNLIDRTDLTGVDEVLRAHLEQITALERL